MLSYQIRKRCFRVKEGDIPIFPAKGSVNLYLLPMQPFGMEVQGGRTCLAGAKVSFGFNANTGEHFISSALKPLNVILKSSGSTASVAGNVLSICRNFGSLKEAHEFVTQLYYIFPMLLNVDLGDPPFVERAELKIGQSLLGWELAFFDQPIHQTTQQDQENFVTEAWERLPIVLDDARHRLLASLHYFHVACRLARRGNTPGEFLAEVILNLSKTIEALFPHSGDGKNREAARLGLRALDFTEPDIEGCYLPAIALRNEIDSGHVQLGMLDPADLEVLHSYVDHVERDFKRLFKRVFERLLNGTFVLPPYEVASSKGKESAVVERLRKYEEKRMK